MITYLRGVVRNWRIQVTERFSPLETPRFCPFHCISDPHFRSFFAPIRRRKCTKSTPKGPVSTLEKQPTRSLRYANLCTTTARLIH